MKRAIHGILVATAISVFILGCPGVCPEDLGFGDPLVGATGDSIHMGTGCSCGGVSLYLGHVLLDKGLEAYRVASFATSGGTLTGDVPSQYENLKAEYPDVDIVLVNGGTNDVFNAEKLGTLDENTILDIAEAIWAYLNTIDNEGKKAVVYRIPYFISPPNFMTQENVDNMNDAIYTLNMAFTAQAASLSFPVFALDAMMEEDPDEYYADWIHPTCAAQEEMAERVALMVDYLLP